MGRQDRLREQEAKYLSKAVPLIDRAAPILDDVGTWLARELRPSDLAPGAASTLSRLEDETKKFEDWQRLEPPGRFRQSWELYQERLRLTRDTSIDRRGPPERRRQPYRPGARGLSRSIPGRFGDGDPGTGPATAERAASTRGGSTSGARLDDTVPRASLTSGETLPLLQPPS